MAHHERTITEKTMRYHAIKAYWHARAGIRNEPHLADVTIAIYSRFWRKETTFINYLREIADEQLSEAAQ